MAWDLNQQHDDFGGSKLWIAEMSGPERVIELEGRAGPLKGPTWGGEMRAEITHYPGNPVGSIQFLGAVEAPTTFRGKWKRRYFGDINASTTEAVFAISDTSGQDTRILTEPMDMVQAMDEVRRGGQLVEVWWAEIVRVGYMKRFIPTVHSRMEVEWELEFEWISQGERLANGGKKSADLSEIDQAVAQDISDMLSALEEPIAPERFDGMLAAELTGAAQAVIQQPSSVVGFTSAGAAPNGASVGQAIAQVAGNETLLERAQNLLVKYGELRDTAASYVNKATDVGNATRQAVAALLGVGNEAQRLYEYTITTTADAWFGVADATLIGVTDLLALTTFTRRIGRGALKTRNTALRAKDDLIRRLEPQLKAVHIADEGQNLRDVSMRYYGTAEGWRFLKQYNGLSGSELSAGEPVFVPMRIDTTREF